MNNKSPVISVIIASYTGSSLLKRCLASILSEKSDSFEVILVNDGSKITLKDSFRNFLVDNRLTYIQLPRNVGAAEARNIGALNSHGKYLFFLDNDTKIKSGWSRNIPLFFKQHTKTGMTQVKLLRMNTKRFDSAGELLSPLGFLVERARGAEDTGQFGSPSLIFSGKSAGMVVRRDMFNTLGGFDKKFHIFWEDTDLCWRMWLCGYEVRFCPTIAVEHAYLTPEKDADIYRVNRVFYYGCRNMITSIVKNMGTIWLITNLPIILCSWLILAFLFLLKLDFYRSSEIARGIFWNFSHFRSLLDRRKTIQKLRTISDRHLYEKVGVKQPFTYYVGKAQAYILQKPF